ncbi:hypothetical protein SAMD00019534_037540 [Acytostelium subglobosum LB1]|uniref:hypothetical protein n=1 Tax=Acytostelium subglobosum LB1 TaxID=1410327 RepID=UPI000644A239|nr:hypothetical protein SAMD00019534_037540 [Acytostelium subglobosum LB1]GAM20579.1 hypothetical protein SAMD00019534_037540 [Acytostelium subglobosum LB1]|eukprot:XP_012760100.1 hypothetical protein SAMD00019534_037540 [Acytostelium subglobosum LB1]
MSKRVRRTQAQVIIVKEQEEEEDDDTNTDPRIRQAPPHHVICKEEEEYGSDDVGDVTPESPHEDNDDDEESLTTSTTTTTTSPSSERMSSIRADHRLNRKYNCLHNGYTATYCDPYKPIASVDSVRRRTTQSIHLTHPLASTREFVPRPDDTDSIKMMLANGFTKCPHTECGQYFPTYKGKTAHIYRVAHECSNPDSCPGCQRGNKPAKSTETLKRKRRDRRKDEEEEDEDGEGQGRGGKMDKKRCLHDNCSLEVTALHVHCKNVHGCTRTYASCPNQRAYRVRFFQVATTDTNSAKMIKDDGLIKCIHTKCHKWFRTMVNMLNHQKDHRGRKCDDHPTCKGCQRLAVAMNAANVILPQSTHNISCRHEGCTRMFTTVEYLCNHCRLDHLCSMRYASCPNLWAYRTTRFRAAPEDTESIKMLLAKGLIKCPHTSCDLFMMVSTSKGHPKIAHPLCDGQACDACQRYKRVDNNDDDVDDDDDDEDDYADVEDIIKIIIIKCPHNGCLEYFQTMDVMKIHLHQDHQCPANPSCDGLFGLILNWDI